MAWQSAKCLGVTNNQPRFLHVCLDAQICKYDWLEQQRALDACYRPASTVTLEHDYSGLECMRFKSDFCS